MGVEALRVEDVAQDLVNQMDEYHDPGYFGAGESLEYDATLEESGRYVNVTARDGAGNVRHFEVKVYEVVEVPGT